MCVRLGWTFDLIYPSIFLLQLLFPAEVFNFLLCRITVKSCCYCPSPVLNFSCLVKFLSVRFHLASSVIWIFQPGQPLLHSGEFLIHFAVFVFSIFFHFSIVLFIHRS